MISVGGFEAVREADLVVNATPLGMREGDELPIDPALLHSGQVVVDLTYGRGSHGRGSHARGACGGSRTPLLAAADRLGATALDGLGMLVFQAAEQFTLWTGLAAPIGAMAAAVGVDLPGVRAGSGNLGCGMR